MIWVLFAFIQVVSFVLMVIGWVVIAFLAGLRAKSLMGATWHFPGWAWIWDNEIDGVCGPLPPTRWNIYYWSALRNPVNNLRFVYGVSKKGRPLVYRTWKWLSRDFYYKLGWMSDGYPCLSFGGGKGGG